MPAAPLAASALPPLKPNQPTHSMPAPAIVMPGLCGGCRSLGKAVARADHQRGDQRRDAGGRVHDDAAGEIHAPRAGEPAAAPHPVRHRDIDQQQPQAGEQQHGGKRMRSAKAPMISAGVMMAKVIWNMREGAFRQTVARQRCAPMPARNGLAERRRSARRRREGEAVAERPATAATRRRRWRSSASAPTARSWPAPARRRTAPGPAGS